MSNSRVFLKHYLGDSSIQQMAKSELFKESTSTVLDYDEIYKATQIVPKTVLALLHKELGEMKDDENKDFPFKGDNEKEATVHVKKHSADNYTGHIFRDGKVIARFKNRSLPGVGIILLSAFELYEFDKTATPAPQAVEKEIEIDKLINERFALHSLISQVVDKKLSEREALDRAINDKMTRLLKDKPSKEESEEEEEEEPKEEMKKSDSAPVLGAKLKAFLDQKKMKKPIVQILMAKGETIDCPDCGQVIFKDEKMTGCVCMGDSRQGKIFIKKTESGVSVRFSKDWDEESVQLLLQTIRQRGSK